MLRISDVDWSEVIGSVERPVKLLLKKGTPVYIKVRRDSEIVYRYYHKSLALEGSPSFPFAGFLDDIAFLRLDDEVLAEIANSRSRHVSTFSAGGFSIPRPFEVTGQTPGGYPIKKPLRIEVADLESVDFDRAFIVDKKNWNLALASMAPINMPSPERFTIQIEVLETDLYVTSSDFESLRQEARQDHELAKYPFDHAGRMPGIYWMFQAAHALNQGHLIGEDKVLDWLRARCAGHEFEGKRGGFAAKLIPLELDRAKGRKGGPRPFKMVEFKSWVESPDRFIFPAVVSDGLTLVLAVALWWEERLEGSPDESRVALAEKLYEQGFDKTEADYIVRLIAGVQLSNGEKILFEEWISQKERKLRMARTGLSGLN